MTPPHGRTVNAEQPVEGRGWRPGTYRVIVNRSGDVPRAVAFRDGSTRVLNADEWLPLVTALYHEAIGERGTPKRILITGPDGHAERVDGGDERTGGRLYVDADGAVHWRAYDDSPRPDEEA